MLPSAGVLILHIWNDISAGIKRILAYSRVDILKNLTHSWFKNKLAHSEERTFFFHNIDNVYYINNIKLL